MTMFDLIENLLDAEIDFVVVGGLAVALHGSIAHLIAMKTGTGRGKDAIDIEELRKIQVLEK